jgi:hypothetical protein
MADPAQMAHAVCAAIVMICNDDENENYVECVANKDFNANTNVMTIKTY